MLTEKSGNVASCSLMIRLQHLLGRQKLTNIRIIKLKADNGPGWAGSRKAGLWATLTLLGKHRSQQLFDVLPDRVSLEEMSF